MVCQKKDCDGWGDCACPHVDVDIGRRIIEDAPLTPVHGAPDNGRRIGVGAACGVNSQLAAKEVGDIGGSPADAGAIAGTWCDLDLGKNSGFERAGAGYGEVKTSEEGVFVLQILWRTVQDERAPPGRNLQRSCAGKGIHPADGCRQEVGGSTRISSLCPPCGSQEHQSSQEQGCRPWAATQQVSKPIHSWEYICWRGLYAKSGDDLQVGEGSRGAGGPVGRNGQAI